MLSENICEYIIINQREIDVSNEDKEIKVPRLHPGIAYSPGRPRSVKKLEELQYDPLEDMVGLARRISAELDRQEQRREGTLVELTYNGKPRYYNEANHIALLGQAQKTVAELMRYKYGRVPEGAAAIPPKKTGSLSITLTKEGDVFEIGAPDDDDGFEDAQYVDEVS